MATTTVISTIKRGLLITTICAAAALGLPAASVGAQDNAPSSGTPCLVVSSSGMPRYVPPGTKVTDVDGKKWVCGPDGTWFPDESVIRISGTINPNMVAGTLGSAKTLKVTNAMANMMPAGTLQSSR